MILLSGDFHLDSADELQTISLTGLRKAFSKEQIEKISCNIILGDGGFWWPKCDKQTDYYVKTLCARGFPTYCLFGNHDNYVVLESMPIVKDQWGNDVIQIYKDYPLYYIPRGKIYNFEDQKFLCLGGGFSIDKPQRVPFTSWWPQELWTQKEKDEFKQLIKTENKFDFILSHVCPTHIVRDMFGEPGFIMRDYQKFSDDVSDFYDKWIDKVEFKHFFFGHMHKDITNYVDKQDRDNLYTTLYRKLWVIEKE